ncbi:aldolase/citrate lyase family protein [Devosia algicola]|uniref:Aldolase/citrate lyase family protein n=1 Tax=Devosia algicola TaxID=3026418 RepID=A0ABY7YRJ2_9HYPH|nr:aldolase/citrate lyase family protein [Devosia algicola]WDR03935.1 aldolase/citrate lyase family protein [Devosia algicola]
MNDTPVRPHYPDITNPMRRALQENRAKIGIWSQLNSTNAIEGLVWAGFDWLLIDCEHAPIELNDVISHLRVLDASPTIPIVRLTLNNELLLKRHLDAGVRSFMLPFVQNAEEAKSAVDAMHYPPRGKRGMAGMHRANRYGAVPDYFAKASESLFLIVQIETGEALDRLEEILAVDGVDAVFFGPTDLSASLGFPGQGGTEKFTKIVSAALERVRKTDKFAGTLALSPAQANSFLEAGFDFVSVISDCALLFGNARQTAARLPSALTSGDLSLLQRRRSFASTLSRQLPYRACDYRPRLCHRASGSPTSVCHSISAALRR